MSKPRIGLLGLTLDFYEQGLPELRPGRERFVQERLVPALGDAAEVRFEGAVFTREGVDRAVAGFEAQGCDAVLVVLLTYAPSLIAAPALGRTRLPVVIWNTQELEGVTGAYGVRELLDNHGVHGTHDLCNVLVRAGVRFEYITGHASDGETIAQLADVFLAARAAARLRQARLGLLGYPFPGMGDFAVDLAQMASTLGCACVPLGVSEYVRRCGEVEGAAAADLVGAYREMCEIGAGVTAEDLSATARAELALRGVVREHRLDALTYQFLAMGEDGRVETLPFVAASRLLAEGIGFGGEGDVISAAGSALLNWLHPPASFSEMFTIDFSGNAVLFSHMGEANVAMSRRDRRPAMVLRESLVPIRGRQLVLASSFEPGEATVMALTLGLGGRWRIIAAPMTIEDFGPLAQLAVPHSKLRPRGDVRAFLTAYAKAGGPHHLAVCFGDARRRLGLLAGIVGAEYVEI